MGLGITTGNVLNFFLLFFLITKKFLNRIKFIDTIIKTVLYFLMEREEQENYQVSIFRSKETGRITHEFWEVSEDHYYCPHGPAKRKWDAETGELTSETWYNREGQIHRGGDQPAVVTYNPYTKKVESEEYFINGKGHRSLEGAPTYIEWDTKSGKVVSEEWKVDGKLHRGNGQPAIINRCTENDVIIFEAYYLNGEEGEVIERDPKTGKSYWGQENDTEPSTEAAPGL